MKITDRTRELAQPIADELGLILWDVKYVKEGASYYLRVFIDKDGGVGINDCEDFTRLMNPVLDEYDYIADSYYFEVSSPGLGRELSRPEHFERFIGEKVRVRLYKAADGVKEYTGCLKSFGDSIMLDCDGAEREFAMSDVARVNLADDEF